MTATAGCPEGQGLVVPRLSSSVRPSARRGAGALHARGQTADRPKGGGPREESGERLGKVPGYRDEGSQRHV